MPQVCYVHKNYTSHSPEMWIKHRQWIHRPINHSSTYRIRTRLQDVIAFNYSISYRLGHHYLSIGNYVSNVVTFIIHGNKLVGEGVNQLYNATTGIILYCTINDARRYLISETYYVLNDVVGNVDIGRHVTRLIEPYSSHGRSLSMYEECVAWTVHNSVRIVEQLVLISMSVFINEASSHDITVDVGNRGYESVVHFSGGGFFSAKRH